VIFKKIKINKKWLIFLGLIVLGCFGLGEISSADTLDALAVGSGFVGSLILKGANAVLYGILKLVFIFLAGAMWLLDVMISPEMFDSVFFSQTAKDGINTGWSFVRDFFNLFFILVIVLIGLSTILGVSKFKDKAMLFRVIFAALLINFSMPITLFVIDASQIFMQFFADSIMQMQFGAKIQELINLGSIVGGTGINLKDNFTFFVIIVTVIVMTVIMTIMLFYLAISLIIRMIALWVLIILSPVAMFGYAMEGTKLSGMRDEWTKSLISWCFYGPVLLFFIWLSIILVDAMSKASEAGMGSFSSNSSNQVSAGTGGLSGFIVALCGIIIPYITAVYLLFYGYDKAKSISDGAATKILEAGSKKISDLGAKSRQIGAWGVRRATNSEAIKEGVKHKMEKSSTFGRFTKKGQADTQAKRNAEAKKRYGGDKGVAEREYYRGKAQETLKKWKEQPPEDGEVDKMFNSENRAERMAAISYKSQNNKLGIDADGKNLYAEAMEKLGKDGDTGMQQQITREAGKENMGAVVDYETQKKLKVEQAVGGALHGLSVTDHAYNVREEEISNEIHEEKLGKKSLKDVFKNQQQSFYLDENGNLRPGVLKFLHDKALTKPDQVSRKKFADELGDNTVIEAIRASGNDGKYILGERDLP